MPRLLDGLLNPDEDLYLLSLALRDEPTYAIFAQRALFRPLRCSELALRTFRNRHRGPTSDRPNCASSAEASSLPARKAASDIANGRPEILVPHLRLPWAASLIDVMLRRLNIRVVTHVDAPPLNPLAYQRFMETLAAADTTCQAWKSAVERFYAPLPEPDAAYNAVVFAYIRKKYGPLALENIAGCVRLAFVNSLLGSLRGGLAKASKERADIQKREKNKHAAAPSRDAAAAPTSAPSSALSRKLDAEESLNGHAQEQGAGSEIALLHLGNVPMPILAEGTHPLSFTTTSADIPGALPKQKSPRHRPVSCFVEVKGHPIPDVSGSFDHPQSFLVNGVVIPGRLSSTVTRLFAERYGVKVHIAEQVLRTPHRAGSLVSLSNLGTALLRPTRSSASSMDLCAPALRPWQTTCSSLRLGQGTRTSGVGQGIDDYLLQTFGLRWSNVCAEVLDEAAAIADRERLVKLSGQVQHFIDTIACAEDLRAILIRRAIAFETAGSSLARICAFSIARHYPCAEVEQELEHFPLDYVQLLREAKCRIQQLEASDSVSVGELVPPLPMEPL